MTTTVFQEAFSAGELSPGLISRVAFAKYKSGCLNARNQFIDIRGGISNRPGTSFVGRSKQTSVISQQTIAQYYPAGTTSITVPVANFVVECFGPGADSGLSVGGGGGAYAKKSFSGMVPGATYTCNIPVQNPSHGDVWTWFDSLTTVRAHGGGTNGFGGDPAKCIGDIVYGGGNGGGLNTNTGGGGGGSAGPGGAGNNGGDSPGFQPGGSGGGGQGGGTAGSQGNANPLFTGGNGGHNAAGQLGGAGGANMGVGADATNAGSGGGGSGFNGLGAGKGADDRDSGGGGGGGVNGNSTNVVGGNGGFPGGGGGISRGAGPSIGGTGQIKVSWGGGGGGGGSIPAGGCPGFGTTPRLIPFIFSTVQAYVLEFGNQYMRIIMNGGFVTETPIAITGITNANPAVMSVTNTWSNGDWIFVTGVGGMTQVNGKTFIVAGRTGATIQLHNLDGNPVDSTAFGVYTSGGTAARIFTLATPYLVQDLPLLKFAQSADVLTIAHPSYPPADITRTGNAAWTYTPITFAPNIGPPGSAPTVTSSGAGSSTYRYVVTAVSASTSEESRASAIGSVTGITMSQNVGANNRLHWSPVAGAGYYNVYRQPEVINGAADYGQIYGFIGTTTGVSLTDQNIAPDFSRSPPQPRNPFLNSTIQYWTVTNGGSGYTTGPATVTDAAGTGWIGFIEATAGVVTAIITQYGGQNYSAPTISAAGGTGLAATATIGPATGNYPGCVTYFQQRKCFAASTNFPETFWMTQIGNFNNFDVSVPARDSDAITGTIASTEVNAIKFLQPMASGLIVGSSDGAWQVSGGALGEPVTPSNVVASPQAFNGASDVPPIPVNYDILYVQNQSNVVRDLTYNFYVNNYVGADMTVLANHLFYGFEIEEWAYQEEPTKVVWAVRNDGTLLSFTFLKEQEIYAWTHGDTQGQWVSVAAIPEGQETAVYLIAQRQIPGVNSGSPVFYVERMQSRQLARAWTNNEADPTNAWFQDCALQYSFVNPPACAFTASNTIITDTASFTTASVGNVIRITDGIFDIGAFVSTTQVTGTWSVLPDRFGRLVSEGDWTLTTPVSTVTGLDHLEGASVIVLSNGSVEGPYTVVNGSITLQEPSDIVTVGLAVTYEGASMYVDLGQGGPTVAGKRKSSDSVTCYLENSRGLSFGGISQTTDLTELKERTDEQMGQPTRLWSGENRVNIYSEWTVQGQIFWRSEYPLPFTLLGLAVDYQFGDNAR